MGRSVTPWWKALRIRREILGAAGQIDDVQMSLFRALDSSGTDTPPYANATYYGEITHAAERLTDLLAEIAVRIGGGSDYLKARSVTRLDQGMGGGKSHACIGAYHLAAHPEALFSTELGHAVASRSKGKIGRELPQDLNHPHVVVLPCDNMTPGAPSRELDGPAVNLYERFLWRLFSKDYSLFERYRPFYNDKNKIGEALRAVGRPVLVIIDEVLDYVGNGLDGADRPELAAQDMGFLRALLDVINDVPNAAMLVVMIASERDTTALTEAGRDRRDDLNALLERNGTPATVTEVGDFADILRRRLFEAEPAAEVLAATAAMYEPVLEDRAWERNVWEQMGARWRDKGLWAEEVSSVYPFHPMLMATAKEEWSKVAGFQRVRSTIRIFAATVYALQQRGVAGEWVPALIGPGDLPLSDSSVRESLLGSGLVEDERTIANYRSLAEIEIVNKNGSSGTARRQDRERESPTWSKANPRASERAATFIFLASIVGTLRPGRGRGASAPEVKAATSVPDLSYTVTDADTVVQELVDQERGMSALEIVPGRGNNKPARYFLSTRLTHRMLVSNIRRTITEAERDEVIAEFAKRLSNSGPFRTLTFVEADFDLAPANVLAKAGLDTAHTNRLVVLDPSQFSLRNGAEHETLTALKVAMGLGGGTEQIPVQWASSAIYAVVNTQRRSMVRNVAMEYLARQKALDAPEIQNDQDLKVTGTRELTTAKEQLEKTTRHAYQHVCYLAQPDPDGVRYLDQLSFDDEQGSALNGTMVWKALVERDKAFDEAQFGSKALLHNLRNSDYGRTLSDIRAAFYSAPRMPLLYGGDRDLQQAIYDAVEESSLEIVDGTGNVVAVTMPGQVNLTSAGLRLAKPVVRDESIKDPGPFESNATNAPTSGQTESAASEAQQQVAFSFTRNLLNSSSNADHLAALFRILYVALDERKVSYAQGTLQIVVDSATAENLQLKLEEVGIASNIKDL